MPQIAGANQEVQYNNNGNLGGSTFFTFDQGTQSLSIQNINVTGRVQSALIPDSDISYDLGSATNRWKDLYLSNATIS